MKIGIEKMKKYLTILVLLAYTQVSAENNPFNVQDNLQRIDKDQNALLLELKKLSKEKKKKEKNVAQESIDKLSNIVNSEKNVSLEDNVDVKIKKDEEENLRKLIEEQLQLEQKNEKFLEEQKEAQHRINLKREQEKAALAKRKQEKLEVEAYEAKRRKKKEVGKKEAIVNIDIAYEKRIEKQNADKEYLRAIEEVR